MVLEILLRSVVLLEEEGGGEVTHSYCICSLLMSLLLFVSSISIVTATLKTTKRGVVGRLAVQCSGGEEQRESRDSKLYACYPSVFFVQILIAR